MLAAWRAYSSSPCTSEESVVIKKNRILKSFPQHPMKLMYVFCVFGKMIQVYPLPQDLPSVHGDFPGKIPEGCHLLLQRIFRTSGTCAILSCLAGDSASEPPEPHFPTPVSIAPSPAPLEGRLWAWPSASGFPPACCLTVASPGRDREATTMLSAGLIWPVKVASLKDELGL